MHDNGIGACRRLLDPERLEEWKLLALGFAGVNRQSAGGKAVRFSLGDGAEIARAEKDADFIMIVGLVDRSVQAKAREAEVGVRVRRRRVAKGEVFRVIGDLGRPAIHDLKDVHAVDVEEAAMKKLDFERQLFTAPE